MTVARQHDLLSERTQMPDQDSKLFLAELLVFQKLDVVQKQDIAIFVFILEGFGELAGVTRLEFQGLVHGRSIVHEIKSLAIDDARIGLRFHDLGGNRLEQMGFAKTGLAIHKKRIQGRIARIFGNRLASFAGSTVTIALDKVFERIVGIQRKLNARTLLGGSSTGCMHRRNLRGGRSRHHLHVLFGGCNRNLEIDKGFAKDFRKSLAHNIRIMRLHPVFTQFIRNGKLDKTIKNTFVFNRIQNGQAKIVITFQAQTVQCQLPDRRFRIQKSNRVCHVLPII